MNMLLVPSLFLSVFAWARQPAAVAAIAGGDGGIEANEKASNKRHSHTYTYTYTIYMVMREKAIEKGKKIDNYIAYIKRKTLI